MSSQQKMCQLAGKQLFNELSQAGVELTGVGVGLASDGKSSRIQIYLLNNHNEHLVPTSYQGYEVKSTVTGQIVPL